MMSGGTPNVNQHMIAGLLQNAAVIILFIMPMVTMRTYSEEKRSGTIELLLTSPVTDWQIILGKFFGAMGLYAAMLGLGDDSQAVDIRTVQARLERDGVLEECGGVAYLATLDVDLPDLSRVDTYVDIVRTFGHLF